MKYKDKCTLELVSKTPSTHHFSSAIKVCSLQSIRGFEWLPKLECKGMLSEPGGDMEQFPNSLGLQERV